MFEDSGWYNVNYYTGGLFKTGKVKGCNLLLLTCIATETKKADSLLISALHIMMK